MSKYSIGIDLGTKSIRSVLVDIYTGEEINTSVSYYKKGILDSSFFDSNLYKSDMAIEDPLDYEESLFNSLETLLKTSNINKDDVVGIGIDSTCSTFLPVDKDHVPLSTYTEFKRNPHAYVTMWKHHSASKYADEITEYDLAHGTLINEKYGRKTNAEFFFPKLLELYNDSKDVYDKTYSFMEVGDYCIYLLSGAHIRSEIVQSCKYYYENGKYLVDDFIKDKHPEIINYKDKLNGEVIPNGAVGGYLSKKASNILGLKAGIPISSLNCDALVNPLAFDDFSESYMVSVIGTSICNIINRKDYIGVDGIFDTIYDASIKSYYSYESGQCACGDILESFINMFSEELKQYDNPFDHLNSLASKLKIGESGLVALDFFNGNRSILNDANVSGLVLGLTLNTRIEEIYLCLLESIAFGFKKIVDNYKDSGILVNKILACGGIPKKNPFFMQLLSDVLNMEIVVARSKYSSALASSVYGAYLSGYYESLLDASKKMGGIDPKSYKPNALRNKQYDELYKEYNTLYTSKEVRDIMHRLNKIKNKQ